MKRFVPILVAVVTLARALPAFSLDWSRELAQDGSTNQLPLAVDSQHTALTLTLVNDGPPYLWEGYRRYALDGTQLLSMGLAAWQPFIVSRRDLQPSDSPDQFWVTANVETSPRGTTRYQLLKPDGTLAQDWTTAHCVSCEVEAIQADGGGGLYSAGNINGTGLMVAHFSAPQVLDWQRTFSGIGGGQGMAIRRDAAGGLYVGAGMGVTRFNGGGTPLWTTDLGGRSAWYEDFGMDADGAGGVYVAAGVSGQFVVYHLDAGGASSVLAQWGVDGDDSLGCITRLPDGRLLVGGSSAAVGATVSKIYLACLSTTGALQWQTNLDEGTNSTQTARRLAFDGVSGFYATTLSVNLTGGVISSTNKRLWHFISTGQSPSPTVMVTPPPTATPTPTPGGSPLATPTPMATPTPAPLAAAACQPRFGGLAVGPDPLRAGRPAWVYLRVDACPPNRIRFTLYGVSGARIRAWSSDRSVEGGWNRLPWPHSQGLPSGVYVLRADGEGGAGGATWTSHLMVLR